jgi:hypothetical protein
MVIQALNGDEVNLIKLREIPGESHVDQHGCEACS